MKPHRLACKLWRLICIIMLLCCCLTFNGCVQNTEEVAELTRSCGNSSFDISADALGTEAKGEILIYEKEKAELGIKIILLVSVGPTDFGGVAFYLPQDCTLDNVLYTYPEADNSEEIDPPVELWVTESDNAKFSSTVEIGRKRDLKAAGGGTGTIIIDASYTGDDANPVDSLTFAVECGANQNGGSVIWGTEHSEILVDINKTE